MNLLTMIVGNPSTGKTTSLRNLDERTIILNYEKKALPFPSNGIVNFPMGPKPSVPRKDGKPGQASMSAMDYTTYILDNLKNSEKFDIVVIDSFSAFTDMLLAECKSKYKGFDVFNHYNSGIYEFFQHLKSLENKLVFVISHIEYLQDAEGTMIIRSKIKGKEWEGLVEKEATCVLYSRYVKKPTGKGVFYQFVTNSDGYLPGKTPLGMFDQEKELYIPNDLAQVIQRYRAYYRLDPQPNQEGERVAV
ncbi:ATP-binding protein [Algoriphagus marincola]|uniref:ATP-binding protein n=1 Tax=Algoriphagus marincola TaxID=264027 RepID=A0ABS7N5Q5_9BACT|nr:AAA family ATPase [Algoriphagus marincola]MBY5950525.1 ATP-binding protein [Algoriphagus marincola]